MKFVYILEYFPQSLAQPAHTVTSKEKDAVKKLTKQVPSRHDYFKKVWFSLNELIKNKIFELISSGKGITPYEKIRTFNWHPKMEFSLRKMNSIAT